MPSTTSSSVSMLLDSSTVMTPSLPTFFMASAILAPISLSPLAEMVPTWAISSLEVTFLAFTLSSETTAFTARSTPRLRSIGLEPAATDLAPSRMIACASTVAVVVPSPAMSEVLEATSRSIWAPMFSNLSSSSISLATVTPSLLTRGAPKLFSSTTLRPLGPSVTLTALARMSTPRSMRSRASTENLTSLAAITRKLLKLERWPLSIEGLRAVSTTSRKPPHASRSAARFGARLFLDHPHDVALLHDEQLLPIDLHLGARPLAKQHLVASLDVEGDDLAGLVTRARAGCDDLALLGLLGSRVGNDDAARALGLLFDAAHDHAIMQRTELHGEIVLLNSRG